MNDVTAVFVAVMFENGDEIGDPDSNEVCDIDWFNKLPDDISFGDAGHETYQVIVDSSPVTIELPNQKSLAVGGAVAGSAIAAGLARKLLHKTAD